MSHFDQSAATWDQNPVHMELSKKVSAEMLKIIPVKKDWDVLDYGCGTGSLSFCLKNYFNSIVMADDSSEMLRVLSEKIKTHQVGNMVPVKLNLMSDHYNKIHNLIYTQMALHHIKDTQGFIERLYSHIAPDGFLAIADLVKEDGSFHSHIPDYDGINGFIPLDLEKILKSVEFEIVYSAIIFEMERFINNTTRKYPVFLIICKK